MSNEDFLDFLSAEMAFFFQTNDTPDIGRSTLWETFKAYLRGQVISFVSRMNKIQRPRLKWLSDELIKVDGEYSVSPSSSLYQRCLKLHSEYELLSTSEIEKQLLITKPHFFEQGDKAGKLLAQQARAISASRLIPQIKSNEEIVSDPQKINKIFSNYYSKLVQTPQT